MRHCRIIWSRQERIIVSTELLVFVALLELLPPSYSIHFCLSLSLVFDLILYTYETREPRKVSLKLLVSLTTLLLVHTGLTKTDDPAHLSWPSASHMHGYIKSQEQVARC